MQIRKAVSTDKEQLRRLLVEFDEYSSEALSETQQRIRAYKDREKMAEECLEKFLSKPKYLVFVAEKNIKLIGHIVGKVKIKEDRIYDHEGYIKHFFVQPKYQSQKVGKQLLEVLTEAFKQAGCTHLGVDTHLENTKAIEIYEHLGFTKRLVTFFKVLKNE